MVHLVHRRWRRQLFGPGVSKSSPAERAGWASPELSRAGLELLDLLGLLDLVNLVELVD